MAPQRRNEGESTLNIQLSAGEWEINFLPMASNKSNSIKKQHDACLIQLVMDHFSVEKHKPIPVWTFPFSEVACISDW